MLSVACLMLRHLLIYPSPRPLNPSFPKPELERLNPNSWTLNPEPHISKRALYAVNGMESVNDASHAPVPES